MFIQPAPSSLHARCLIGDQCCVHILEARVPSESIPTFAGAVGGRNKSSALGYLQRANLGVQKKQIRQVWGGLVGYVGVVFSIDGVKVRLRWDDELIRL